MYKYDGFISYRHSERESAIARAIQKALHRFAKPFWKPRAVQLYRDETNLSARPDLWGTIAQALDASRFFLLMASPEAASSKGVRREVEHWLHRRGTVGLIVVQTGGSLVWDDQSKRFDAAHTSALPAPLLERLDTEPLYVDLTWIDKPNLQLVMSNPRFADVIATIAAEMHGKDKDAIAGDDVREHRRTWRAIRGVVSIILLLAVGAGIAAWNYFLQRNEAVAQQNAATSRGLAARAEVLVELKGTLLTTAGLLAVEGMKRAPSLETDRAIRRVLALLPKRVADMDPALGGETREGTFSPDGSYLAALGSDGITRVWETSTGRSVSELPTGSVEKLTFSPTNHHLIALHKGVATEWDLGSHGKLKVLQHEGVRDIAYSRDGSFLASVGADRMTRLWLWHAPTFDEIANFPNAAEMSFVAIAPGAAELVAWNRERAEFFRTPGLPALTMPMQALVKFEYGPKGQYLSMITPGNPYLATLFDTGSKEPLLFEERHWDAAFSGDGKVFALASPEWVGRAYDLPSCNRAGIYFKPSGNGTLNKEYLYGHTSCRSFDAVHHDNGIETVVLSHNGSRLATTSRDRTARVWDWYGSRSREVLRLLEDIEGEIHELSFSPDGRLVTGWGPGTRRTWEAEGHRQVVALPHPDAISDVAFSGNGQSAATVGQDGLAQDGTVRIWGMPEGKEIRKIPVPRPPSGTFSVALSSDGSRLLVNQSEIWDLREGERIAALPLSENTRLSAMSADWQFVVSVTNDNRMVVFKDDTKVATHEPLGRAIEAVAVAPDGCCVATAVTGEGVRIWRWAEQRESPPIALVGEVGALSFDGSGTQVAVIMGDQHSNVAVLDVTGGRLNRTLEHEGEVASAAFDLTGRFVVTASDDRTVRVWNATTGAIVAQFEHDADVTDAEFSPDGKYVLSAGGRSDRKARLWLWRPEDLIDEACSRLRRKSLSDEEWRQYVATENRLPTCPPDKVG
ncbi:MAG: toll/interleukin-1 receptor domain-containing protein [Geminicoccaceae bacterium]